MVMLLSQVRFLQYAASQTLRRGGLQLRRGLFTRQRSEEMRWENKSPKSASLKARGSGIYGIKNKEAGWSEAWGV